MSGLWAVVLGVTGATGSAVARALARDPGLHVFGVHRGHHPEMAEEVERDIRATGRRVHHRLGDAGTYEGAQAGADELLALAGPRSVRISVHAIANASVGPLFAQDGRQLQPRHFHKTLESMANSFVYWAQALLARDLLAPEARLIGFTNPFDESMLRNTGLISASKFALHAYVRQMAMELGPRGYRVNLIKFGGAPSAAVSHVVGGAEMVEQMKRVFERSTPAGEAGAIPDVAAFVSVLAGPSASRFNGAMIDLTGGQFQGLLDALFFPEKPV